MPPRTDQQALVIEGPSIEYGETTQGRLSTSSDDTMRSSWSFVGDKGDIVNIRPKHIMTHDNTSAVMGKFKSIGAAKIFNPRQPVYAIDHDIQNKSEDNLAKYAKIEAFAREHDVDFYPPGTGISHQVMLEEGYVTPGSMCVGSDSHSNIYGALAAMGTPVVRTSPSPHFPKPPHT